MRPTTKKEINEQFKRGDISETQRDDLIYALEVGGLKWESTTKRH